MKNWKKDIPNEILNRFDDRAEKCDKLEDAIAEAEHLIEIIADGGTNYSDEPEQARIYVKECKAFLKRYTKVTK